MCVYVCVCPSLKESHRTTHKFISNLYITAHYLNPPRTTSSIALYVLCDIRYWRDDILADYRLINDRRYGLHKELA